MSTLESVTTLAAACLLLGFAIGWLLHAILVDWAHRRVPADFDDVFLGFREGRHGQPVTSIREYVEDERDNWFRDIA